MAERGLEGLVIRRSFGGDHLDTVSQNAAASPHDVLVELVNNAYDADSKHVEVWVDDTKVVVVDQGCGMLPEDLHHFYRLGDSPKKKDKISPLGRHRLGQFGVATISMRTLAHQYTLTTVKDGIQTTLSERFKDVMTLDDKVIVPPSTRVPTAPSGTRIEMTDLKVSSSQGFTSESVRKYLARTYSQTVLTDMTVSVNGILVTSRKIENAAQFDVDAEGVFGKISGKIYLTGKPIEDPGVYLIVNGRRIGTGKDIVNLHQVSDSTARRIYAQINADGMEKHIRQDRGAFHPGKAVTALSAFLIERLHEVNRYAEKESVQAKGVKLRGAVEPTIEEAHARLRGAKIPEVSRVAFELTDSLPPHMPAQLHLAAGKLYLNKGYPTHMIDRVASREIFKQAIMMSAVEAIAVHRTKQIQTAQPFDTYQKQRTLLIGSVFAHSAISKSGIEEIFPNLRYTVPVLANKSHLSLGTVRYFGHQKLMHLDSDETVRGEEFAKIINQTKGLIPLPTFVQDHMTASTAEATQIERLTAIFDRSGKEIVPFIVRYGDPGCYFIEKSTVKTVGAAIADIDQRTATSTFVPRIIDYGSKMFTLGGLAEHLGIKQNDIAEVLTHAQDKGLDLGRKINREPEYRLANFITAYQHQRGNSW